MRPHKLAAIVGSGLVAGSLMILSSTGSTNEVLVKMAEDDSNWGS